MIWVPICSDGISPTLLPYFTCLDTSIRIAKNHSQHVRASGTMDNDQSSLPTTTCQSPTVITASDRQRYPRITVASLCCNADEENPAMTATTETKNFHQLECSTSAAFFPSPHSLHSQDCNSLAYATQAAFCCSPNAAKLRADEQDEADSRNATVSLSSTPPFMTGGDMIMCLHPNAVRIQSTTRTAYTESSQCVRRPARPSYTEEQKFFIVYYRLIRKFSWREIGVQYAEFFNSRNEDGLTSVYYRTRDDWGMGLVRESEIASESDRGIVEERASNFSKKFLKDLGYAG